MGSNFIFNELDNNAREMLDYARFIEDILSHLNEAELNEFSDQSLHDLEKIKIGLENLKKDTLQFINTDIPRIQEAGDRGSEMLVKIRHDLRTPMNGIMGYSELIAEELADKNLIDLSVKLGKIQGISNDILMLIDLLKLESTKAQKPGLIEPYPAIPLAPTEIKLSPKIYNRVGYLLIVDDIRENRELLHEWLTRKKYQVVEAPSGKAALDFLEADQTVDIVLLDIMMPEMDGYEVLSRIKTNPKLANIIIIMISALEEMNSIVRCIKNGADDYLVKPFNAYLLEARIFACLERKRVRDNEQAYLHALQQELYIAQKIQSSMLPTRIPDSTICNIYGRSVPAREVGGDFYDWYELAGNKMGFCIGDVSGKGISAALFMAVTRTILNTLSSFERPTSKNMEEVNRLLLQNNESFMFVTLFYGVLDLNTLKLTYINAGHWHPLLIKKGGLPSTVEGLSGPAMGVIEDVSYMQFELQLEKGDKLFLYTDGVTESVDADYNIFGLENLIEILKKHPDFTSKKLVEKVIHQVISYSQEEDILDDITCLALSINEEQE